jgi:phytol kinase
MLFPFVIDSSIKMGVYLIIMYLSGLFVLKKGVKVNYTRKINHFSLLAVPFLFGIISRSKPSGGGANDCVIQIIGLLSGLLFFVLFFKPIRERVSIFNTAFAGIDRPEDRPYTLRWITTQTAVNFILAIPIAVYLNTINKPELIFIIILINGIGDGLAEPVGIRFGKHKYQTYALFTNRKYERTIEGSICVFMTSIVVVILFGKLLSPEQFVIALITFPIAMTFVEAKAPHTWDNPFLLAVGSILLFLILHFVI